MFLQRAQVEIRHVATRACPYMWHALWRRRIYGTGEVSFIFSLTCVFSVGFTNLAQLNGLWFVFPEVSTVRYLLSNSGTVTIKLGLIYTQSNSTDNMTDTW